MATPYIDEENIKLTPEKMAIIGSGGREHALAWKFAQELHWDNVYTLPGNAGIPNSHPMDINDFEAIEAFCKEHEISSIFVGPEAPLANGIVNYFQESKSKIKALGPGKVAAQLESSKIFSKKFMEKHGVATSPFQAFERVSDAQALVIEKEGNLVIKYDGLAGGKGVYVCDSITEANEALEELRTNYGEDCPFLIEDKIVGDEISIIGFVDNQCIKLLLPSQDHKQLNDGDTGPNTGGMGAFCPVPFWDEELRDLVQKTIVQPTFDGIQAENMYYKGVIYFGIMIGADGPQLLEYNVRFGDPETEVLLPSLKTSLFEIFRTCFSNMLTNLPFEFNEGYFVDIVQVSGGYPKAYPKGYAIEGLDTVQEDTLVFHAGTKLENDQIVTNGGRVLNIVCQGNTLEEAIEKAYSECAKITFKDQYYRKDIGQRKNIMFKA
ncbi:MAG: phosphoribosylamine--glycine ligase [Aureispira sp.]|nr:phosphoribosylamine--glycine ligase [Aureispira sp.]